MLVISNGTETGIGLGSDSLQVPSCNILRQPNVASTPFAVLKLFSRRMSHLQSGPGFGSFLESAWLRAPMIVLLSALRDRMMVGASWVGFEEESKTTWSDSEELGVSGVEGRDGGVLMPRWVSLTRHKRLSITR